MCKSPSPGKRNRVPKSLCLSVPGWARSLSPDLMTSLAGTTAGLSLGPPGGARGTHSPGWPSLGCPCSSPAGEGRVLPPTLGVGYSDFGGSCIAASPVQHVGAPPRHSPPVPSHALSIPPPWALLLPTLSTNLTPTPGGVQGSLSRCHLVLCSSPAVAKPRRPMSGLAPRKGKDGMGVCQGVQGAGSKLDPLSKTMRGCGARRGTSLCPPSLDPVPCSRAGLEEGLPCPAGSGMRVQFFVGGGWPTLGVEVS